MFGNKKPENTEENEKSTSADKLVIGIILGGAVGSIMALMFAPEKGEKTRAKVIEKTGDFIEGHPQIKKGVVRRGRKTAKTVLNFLSRKLGDASKKI